MSRTALVVDDSMLIRHTVCRFLEERGYIVESATNGVDALAALRKKMPDVLITDMMMPKMDGSQLITEIKKDPRLMKLPIIVLAGRASAAGLPPEHRATATIWKDIDIVAQLEKALKSTLGPDA